ncbi:MAG: DMT family transporter [Verrucomicrobiota bacterium]|nr:DMT family transporter [Verrucomicrobiota bacterium]
MAELSSNKQWSSAGCIVLGSSLISASPFFVEFSGLGAAANSFYRMAIGGAVLFLIAILQQEKWPARKYFGLYLLAALTIALDLVVWNQSVLYIGAGLSTVLANLEIVFLVLIGTLFFREKLPPLFFKMCGLIAIGVCFLIHPYIFEMQFSNILGISFGLAASLIYSIYLILLKNLGTANRGSETFTLALICLFGAAILALFIALTPGMTFSIPTTQGFFYVLSNGLLCQVLGWLLISKGLKGVSLSLSGLLMLAQPALTFIIDGFLMGRNTHWLQILGCVILLAAVYGSMRREKEEKLA